MSIVGVLLVLLGQLLAFTDLGCFLRCDFHRRLDHAFNFCSIFLLFGLLELWWLLVSMCQRPDLFQPLSTLVRQSVFLLSLSSCQMVQYSSSLRFASMIFFSSTDLLVNLVDPLLTHTPYHRFSAQQLPFSSHHQGCLVPVGCRVDAVSRWVQLAWQVLEACAWKLSVSARSSTKFAPMSDGFPLFTSPAFVVSSPPPSVGSDD